MEVRRRSRQSPAIHFLRPAFIIISGLFAYGMLQASVFATAIGAALLAPTAAVAFALHTSHTRQQQQNAGIRCG